MAASFTWTNGNSTNLWTDSLNWDYDVGTYGNTYPGDGRTNDNVSFSGASSQDDMLYGYPSSIQLGSFSIQDSYYGDIDLSNGNQLRCNGSSGFYSDAVSPKSPRIYVNTGFVLRFDSQFNVQYPISILGGNDTNSLVINGAMSLYISGGGTQVFPGTITIGGSGSLLVSEDYNIIENNSTFTNNGDIEISASGVVLGGASTTVVTNNGTFLVDSGEDVKTISGFDNEGSITLNGGGSLLWASGFLNSSFGSVSYYQGPSASLMFEDDGCELKGSSGVTLTGTTDMYGTGFTQKLTATESGANVWLGGTINIGTGGAYGVLRCRNGAGGLTKWTTGTINFTQTDNTYTASYIDATAGTFQMGNTGQCSLISMGLSGPTGGNYTVIRALPSANSITVRCNQPPSGTTGSFISSNEMYQVSN